MNISGLKMNGQLPEDWSEVFEYRENLNELKTKIEKYRKYRNFIIIGNGGSITSFEAYYRALSPDREAFILSTMEPRLIAEIKAKYQPSDTLVIPISKSGNTLGLMESLLAFIDYPKLVITNPEEGTLCEIAKIRECEIITHPNIGGRFSGGTASAIVPAILCGLDVEKILEGLYDGYKLKNEAYSLSSELYELEKIGYTEVYLPIYSQFLMGFENLIVQLMHESVCKDGHGQTFYASLSPESQHHTNQRFLGGRKNVAAIFLNYEAESFEVVVPQDLRDIDIRGEKLGFLNGLNYQKGLMAEYLGTKQDADINNIPNFTITLPEINAYNVGLLLGFWHLMAFYSCLLRGVNPFDQPAVENSKQITVSEIKQLQSHN
ncbi:MAG: hypothetical protein WCO23_04915 [bacterium]